MSAPKRGPIGRFCTPTCKRRYYRPLATSPGARPCQHCETPFTPQREAARFCTKRCAIRAYQASEHGADKRRATRGQQKLGPPFDMECHFCGTMFHVDPALRRNEPKYCGRVCCQQANRDRRRAKLAGTATERIDRNIVFERDEWVCGLCHQPVDRHLKWPDPMSKSLDHIIPISRGGSHTYGNVQCSHLCCNISAYTKRAELELAA